MGHNSFEDGIGPDSRTFDSPAAREVTVRGTQLPLRPPPTHQNCVQFYSLPLQLFRNSFRRKLNNNKKKSHPASASFLF
jgi:hypothetical protein